MFLQQVGTKITPKKLVLRVLLMALSKKFVLKTFVRVIFVWHYSLKPDIDIVTKYNVNVYALLIS